MSIFEGKPAVIIDRRLGTQESPFVSINETLVVNTDGKVILSEIPNRFQKVIVEGDNKTWYEIQEGIPTDNQFKVDYINKVVTFNLSNVGKQLNFKYMGTGNHYYSVHSIYTEENNGIVTETLKQLIDSTKQARNSANDAVNNANQAAAVANEAANNAQKIADNTRYIEPYNPGATYYKNNIVSYNGSSFIAKQTTQGNTPVGDKNDPYWGLLARRGVDGDWNNIQNKPTTFTPSPHTHNWSEINNKPTTLAGYGITDAAPLSHVGAGGSAHATATQTTAGFMSASDKAKLDGIQAGAEVNQNTFANVKVGATTITADAKQDTLELAAGTGVVLTPDAANDKVTIAVNTASTSQAGIVQLVDSVSSTSVTQAPTANAVKQAYDRAVSAENNAKSYAVGLNTVSYADTKSTDELPSYYLTASNGKKMHVEFKQRAAIGLPSTAGTYCTLITLVQWTDTTGGTVKQIAYDESGRAFIRNSNGTSAWNSWQEFETTAGAQTKANQAEANAKSYLDNQKGIPNGIAPLDANGKIPDSYISSTFVKQSQLGNAGYGDMIKSIYDTDNDGIVDRAEVADSVNWNNIQNKPTTFTPSSHTHNWSEINNKPTTLSGYGISDAVNSFSLPANGSSTSYVKIAELTTNIGFGENGLILYVNGVSDFGNNMPGVDILQVSTRGSVGLKAYRLIPSGSNNITYGYVNNGATGKTEIWLKRDAYNYGVNIIVANARNATYGNLLTQGTEPSGIVYVTKETIALTTDLAETASKFTNLNLNIIDMAVELETLKGATLNGVTANIFIETFNNLNDINLMNGVYDSTNKRLVL